MSLLVARNSRKFRERWIVTAALAACALLACGAFALAYGPAYLAYWSYSPQEGDILFQSLPRSQLVNAIEGATGSPYSHCGIASHRDGEWVVYEAYRNVEATPLHEFLFRGRNQGIAVYRLQPDYQGFIPATIKNVQSYLGRPYDARYRMDDERIYCTELIYKAFRDASGGQQLGDLVRLGDLHWREFESTIEHYEEGPVPLDREIITPQGMALAKQLELVFDYNIATAKP
jgi:hypothetical protein